MSEYAKGDLDCRKDHKSLAPIRDIDKKLRERNEGCAGKAAEQGNKPAAQRILGLMYDNGWGVTKDKAQARAWMQKAAAAGDEDAKKWLARN